jgi:hypothetical protein
VTEEETKQGESSFDPQKGYVALLGWSLNAYSGEDDRRFRGT